MAHPRFQVLGAFTSPTPPIQKNRQTLPKPENIYVYLTKDANPLLLAHVGAEVRSINFTELFGSGVLHTKLWIVDGTRAYVGSANMDYRSLTQALRLRYFFYILCVFIYFLVI